METITLTESEVDYILHMLFKAAFFDEGVARVCRLLSTRFPNRVFEGKLTKIDKKAYDKRRVQRISKKQTVEKLQK